MPASLIPSNSFSYSTNFIIPNIWAPRFSYPNSRRPKLRLLKIPRNNIMPAKNKNYIPPRHTKNLEEKSLSVQDIIAPQSIVVDFSHLQIGDYYYRTFFTSINRRFVTANWLSQLINFDHTATISMFIYPVESKNTLDELRRKIAEMEAEIST